MASKVRRTVSRVNNLSWFWLGAVVSYGLTNPDRKNPFELMPVYRQRYYAIIAKFNVNYADHKDFEFFSKDAIRFYQQHTGYLFSHLIRSRDHSTATIDYYLIQTWATMSAFKVAFDSPYRKDLTRLAKARNGYQPQVVKIVADDFEFVPAPVKRNPGQDRVGVRKALDVSSGESKMPSYTSQRLNQKW